MDLIRESSFAQYLPAKVSNRALSKALNRVSKKASNKGSSRDFGRAFWRFWRFDSIFPRRIP
ncbi:MAG: hypothetical protein OYM47_21040 [Gemmatimonadota bacterium]|nr:hypothetical protein [Gemmatimonadota bacterium]